MSSDDSFSDEGSHQSDDVESDDDEQAKPRGRKGKTQKQAEKKKAKKERYERAAKKAKEWLKKEAEERNALVRNVKALTDAEKEQVRHMPRWSGSEAAKDKMICDSGYMCDKKATCKTARAKEKQLNKWAKENKEEEGEGEEEQDEIEEDKGESEGRLTRARKKKKKKAPRKKKKKKTTKQPLCHLSSFLRSYERQRFCALFLLNRVHMRNPCGVACEVRTSCLDGTIGS